MQLRERFGAGVEVVGVCPLDEPGRQATYRLTLAWQDRREQRPGSVVMKGPYEGYDPRDLAPWRPGWRLGQEFVNLEFLRHAGAGAYVPEVYGFDREAGFLLVEDLGDLSLDRILGRPGETSPSGALIDASAALAGLHAAALPHEPEFAGFAASCLRGFVPLQFGIELDEESPLGLLGLGRGFEIAAIPGLREQAGDFARYFESDHRFAGHVQGDMWHEHVLFDGSRARFVDFHCAGPGNVLADLMRLADGTPIRNMNLIPMEVAEQARAVYLESLADTLGWPLTDDLRKGFERSYAAALVECCFGICSREWVHLGGDNRFTWRMVREAMMAAQTAAHAFLPELPALAELASSIQRWFERNRPGCLEGRREVYEAFSQVA